MSTRRAQDAFDQIEAGDEGQVESRRNAARYGEDRDEDAEKQNEGQAPKEVRHGEAGAIGEIDAGLDRGAAETRGGDGEDAAERHGDEKRQGGELERRRQAAEDQAHHVLAQRNRGTEVTLQGAAEPDPELGHNRLVEAVMGGQQGDIGIGCAGRQHHGDGIAGYDPHQDENDERHTEQGDHRRAEADQQISAHTSVKPCKAVREGRRGAPPA